VYKLPKAWVPRKSGATGVLARRVRGSVPARNASRNNVFVGDPLRECSHDKILTIFLISLLRKFQSHVIFEHLHRKDAHCCESKQKSHSGNAGR